MSGKLYRNGVKSPRLIKRGRLYKNDLVEHSNIACRIIRCCSFLARSTPRYIARNTFFRFIPLIRFAPNAMKGIEKLQALDLEVSDEKGNKVTGQKQGGVYRGSVGFNELLGVIKENTSIKGEYRSIILVEDSAGILIGDSPRIIRFLYLEKDDGEGERLPMHPFDPDKPIRDLMNWVENKFRRSLAYLTMFLIAIWLVTNSYMLYLLNK